MNYGITAENYSDQLATSYTDMFVAANRLTNMEEVFNNPEVPDFIKKNYKEVCSATADVMQSLCDLWHRWENYVIDTPQLDTPQKVDYPKGSLS